MIHPCLLAARFLTRLPLPDPGRWLGRWLGREARASADGGATPDAMLVGRSALCYPLVGLLLGALMAVPWLLLETLAGPLPMLAVAAVLLLIWTWSTGGLHLDGLSDCADAWVGGLGSRERTLVLLKDPLTGSMGVVALVLVLMAKFAGLASLPAGPQGALMLLLTPAIARLQLLALALTTVSARPDGLGAALRQGLPRRAGWLVLSSGALAAALLLWAIQGGSAAALMLSTSAIVFWLWRRSMLHRLQGFTGDTAGALVELTEALLLLGLVLLFAA